MPTLLVIGDGTFPDPAARRALYAAGIEPVEPPGGDPTRTGEAPDLVLVDVRAPAREVLDRVAEWKRRDVLAEAPFLLAVEACDLPALRAGEAFHDFLVRPIDPSELVLRARLALFRTRRVEAEGLVRCDPDLAIDTKRYEARLAGRLVDLTLKEYELLVFLATRPGRVFTREVLLDQIWGRHYFGGTRTVDVHVRRLRMKVEKDGRVFIETVRGVGYRFRA